MSGLFGLARISYPLMATGATGWSKREEAGARLEQALNGCVIEWKKEQKELPSLEGQRPMCVM